MARAIHDTSQRKDAPFIPVNCGAISESLLENEFFGHVKGAFTGAYSDKKGFLSNVQGGTLFLDEVGELSLNMQVKLLRAIEGGGYSPVGSTGCASFGFQDCCRQQPELMGGGSKGQSP